MCLADRGHFCGDTKEPLKKVSGDVAKEYGISCGDTLNVWVWFSRYQLKRHSLRQYKYKKHNRNID